RVLMSYQAVSAKLPRTAPRQAVEDVCAELSELHSEIRDVLESFASSQNLNANESQTERHIQNSNPDSNLESEKAPNESNEASGSVAETANLRIFPKRDLPLGIVLDACPAISDFATGGKISQWRDLVQAAELLRPALGISPSAWWDACAAMGDQHAAITLAAIYQRSDQIGSAGGYLRSLTDRAREGKFSTWPMVMALLRARIERQKAGDSDDGNEPVLREGVQLAVSNSLLK